MAFIDVDESELASLRTVDGILKGMLANPASRKLVLQARKIQDPNAAIPEIDAAVPVRAEMEEIRKMLADREAKDAAREAALVERDRVASFEKSWNKQKSTLRSQGWQTEGIERVESFAQERGLPDLEAAAALYEKQNPPPPPVQPSGSGSWGFFDKPEDDGKFVQALVNSKGDNEAALNAEINAALAEVRQSGPAVRR